MKLRCKLTQGWSFGVLVILAFFMGACSSYKAPPKTALPQFNDSLINTSKSTQIPSLESLTALSEAQRHELLTFINREDIKDLPPRLKVTRFIQHKMVNFNYEGQNYTSRQSWENRSGNCMALALLTYSIAKELDVYPVFQVVHAAPILTNISSDILVTSDHVRTFLYDEKPSGHYFSGLTSTVIDYFPDRFDRTGQIISDAELLAMFYRNLAADALLAKNYQQSYLLLQKGLYLAPQYEPLINMMAIIHRRLTDELTAEQIYLYGLQQKPNSVTLLSNYAFLLGLQGRDEEVAKIDKQLLSIDDGNPYRFYSLGIEALEFKNYKSTVFFLEKFLNVVPYYHPAYLALAKAQYELGQAEAAKHTLEKAIELTDLPVSKRLYLAKLAWLNKAS